MRIYLVRHAQSEWQVQPSANWDTSLTVTGHEQARQLAQWLAASPELEPGLCLQLSSLYTSPFARAQQTASYIADALGMPVTAHDTLREAEFHVASHLPQANGPFEGNRSFTPSQQYCDFMQQAQSALRYLVDQAESVRGPVLAVSHGGLIKTLLRSVTGTHCVCFRLFNACVNLIEWRRGRWHLVHLNLWDHLAPPLRTE